MKYFLEWIFGKLFLTFMIWRWRYLVFRMQDREIAWWMNEAFIHALRTVNGKKVGELFTLVNDILEVERNKC